MNLTEKQRKIIHIIAIAIGLFSLFLFFRKDLLLSGIGIITMGILCTCINVQGGELNIIIGLMPILLYYEQRMLLVLWSIIILVVGLYDFLIIVEIRKNLEMKDKKQRGQEFITKFREKELAHVLCGKLVRLLGIKK